MKLKSATSPNFWRLYAKLPKEVRVAARKAYRLWEHNPQHQSLHFKKLKRYDDLYSVRINRTWRAVGLLEGDTVYWNWIGHHAEFDELFG